MVRQWRVEGQSGRGHVDLEDRHIPAAEAKKQKKAGPTKTTSELEQETQDVSGLIVVVAQQHVMSLFPVPPSDFEQHVIRIKNRVNAEVEKRREANKAALTVQLEKDAARVTEALNDYPVDAPQTWAATFHLAATIDELLLLAGQVQENQPTIVASLATMHKGPRRHGIRVDDWASKSPVKQAAPTSGPASC